MHGERNKSNATVLQSIVYVANYTHDKSVRDSLVLHKR